MKLVVIESPFAGKNEEETEANLRYARMCMFDSIHRNEAPIASHLLYTQPGILDDAIPNERQRGIQAGFAWNKHADLVAVYNDLGVSKGMVLGIAFAQANNIPVEVRTLRPNFS